MLKWQTGLVGKGKRVGGLGEGTYAAKTEAPLLPPVPRRVPARDRGKKSLVPISVDPLSPPPTPSPTGSACPKDPNRSSQTEQRGPCEVPGGRGLHYVLVSPAASNPGWVYGLAASRILCKTLFRSFSISVVRILSTL